MPAVAMPKDDWTPAKLKSHEEWRRKMYARQKLDVLAMKIEVVKDPDKLAMESRMREMEETIGSLRKNIEEARLLRAAAMEPVECLIPLRVEHIIRVVAKFYGFSAHDLKSARRGKAVCLPRHVAMYLCKQLTLRSLPEIGRHFGGRDHTTALHGISRIARLMLADAAICQEVAGLEGLFNGKD